jgi:hypothetical protein
VIYCKRPFAGPKQVLRYLSRYTHRVAISNRRLISADENGVTFKYKDYRLNGSAPYKTMRLATDEFIRRFLIHVLPKGLHRICHYGLSEPAPDEQRVLPCPCPCCGGRMIVIETFARSCEPKSWHTPASQEIRIDTS